METGALQNNNNLTPVKFHFFKIKFTPYSGTQHETSHSIISKVMNYLSKQAQEGKGFLIDKHEARTGEASRPLFATSVVWMGLEKRYRGSMALLRTGKIPMLKPTDKFKLIPLDTSIGEIAEQTRFYIDYKTDSVIMCVEFNYNGPRTSDLEYYFRIVARDQLRIAKAVEVETFMDVSIDKALAELRNVLSFEVKVQPQKLAQLDTALVGQYFSTLTTFNSAVKPKYLKLEALFQHQGKQVGKLETNKGANTMVSRFLKAFKDKEANIEAFENFVVKYEDKDGKEELFNLLKGKKEIIKHIDIRKLKGREWYELIKPDIDQFIESL